MTKFSSLKSQVAGWSGPNPTPNPFERKVIDQSKSIIPTRIFFLKKIVLNEKNILL
jgi:hypothetical protein